jgi:uncharacterized protein YjiS (DUF1127 family)
MRQEIETIGSPLSSGLRPAVGFGGMVRWAVAHTIGLVLTWQQRARERRHLASMDEHGLKDIGLTRVDVLREADKPFWQG